MAIGGGMGLRQNIDFAWNEQPGRTNCGAIAAIWRARPPPSCLLRRRCMSWGRRGRSPAAKIHRRPFAEPRRKPPAQRARCRTWQARRAAGRSRCQRSRRRLVFLLKTYLATPRQARGARPARRFVKGDLTEFEGKEFAPRVRSASARNSPVRQHRVKSSRRWQAQSAPAQREG